ncbi:MAG: response regulator transcription factor [Sedimentisphaerales bacterium]|nr:response regulator transcription factor [Sedimentisphaerales bacterium]
MTVKILLADDHAIIRQGLCALLEKHPDFEVVGAVENGLKAIELVGELKPNIVIMDVTMPNLNGIDAARRILEKSRSVKIIALSMHSNRRFVAEMLEAGALAYILKECLFDELVEAIRTVLNGRIYLSPKITGIVVDDYIKRMSPEYQQETVPLTEREREVLQLLAEGKSTKQIALRLHVSDKTIESNRRNIMEKLQIHSIAELTKYAVREGITPLDS